MHVVRKLTVLALLATLALVVGALRPGQPPERSEAIFPVGGIAALPSSLPAVVPIPTLSPGTPQTLPAIAPASGDGSFAIVDVFCDRSPLVTWCPTDRTGRIAPIEFTITKLFPPDEAIGATFTANGQQTLNCTDDSTCDLTDWVYEGFGVSPQHVAVGLTGGGVNEALTVRACDIHGDCREVMVFFIETIFVFPAGYLLGDPGGTPAFVSYRCDDVGLYDAQAAAGVVPALFPGPDPLANMAASPQVTWEEVFDWFYGIPGPPLGIGNGRLRSPTTALPMPDIPFYSCGGDTASSVDDRVNFETDLGIFSIEGVAVGALTALPVGGQVFVPMGTLTPGCDVGDSVDVIDHPGPMFASNGWFFPPQPLPPDTFCDLDFAPNGVVTYTLWPTGDRGTATVTAQQSGGGGVLRTGYPPFSGLGSLGLVMEAPEVIGLEGGEFSLVVLDPELRFLGGQTLQCQAEPLDAVLALVPQTVTSGQFPEPFANFTLYPTRVAVETGVDVTVTCFLDSNPDVKIVGASRIGKPAETVELVVVEAGCSPETATWPDGTDVQDLVGAVTPAKALTAVWQLADPATGEWLGWSADVPAEENDLLSVDFLDTLFFCVSEEADLTRPLVQQ